MKTTTIALIIISFLFLQCSTSKFIKEPPFTVNSAKYKTWVGGQPGVSGKQLKIELDNATNIEFDSIFFKGKKTNAQCTKNKKTTLLIGHFSSSRKMKRDFILDANPTKELKNEPPIKNTFPFKLKANEAVISYFTNNGKKYFKVENIEKISTQNFK